MFDRFTDEARKAMAMARKEAERLLHDCIGTPHLALGVLGPGAGATLEILSRLDISASSVREKLLHDVLPGPPGMKYYGQLPFTPAAKIALEGSMAAAMELGHSYIGTAHLLLGLLTVGDDTSQRLIGCGLDVERVKSETDRMHRESFPTHATNASTVSESMLNASITSALRRSQEIREEAGRERARLDNSVTGRPKIVFLDKNGQPGRSLWLEATPDGALRLVEDREPDPLRVEITLGPDGKLRIAGHVSPAPPARE